MNPRPAIAAVTFLVLTLGTGAVPAEASGRSTADGSAASVGMFAADSSRLARARADLVPLAEAVRVVSRVAGLSGSLRVSIAHTHEPLALLELRSDAPLGDVTYRWLPLLGTPPEVLGGELRLVDRVVAPSQAGVWRLQLNRGGEQHEVEDLTLVTKVPFAEKRNGRLNGYVIGRYATEGSGRTDAYAPPAGFIEVTPANQNLHVSTHLRIGQFLTKNQFNVWPKYVALDLRLIDKLELVVQELHAMGVRADRIHVMSGFRTPSYNGPGEGGRALLSRHTYGDAADIWIENGAVTGYIADLNGDGRRDTRDAEVIQEAVERVEQKYPELLGGIGVYRENGSRGPFVHIDVRGSRSRW